jgi:hypothetical protein
VLKGDLIEDPVIIHKMMMDFLDEIKAFGPILFFSAYKSKQLITFSLFVMIEDQLGFKHNMKEIEDTLKFQAVFFPSREERVRQERERKIFLVEYEDREKRAAQLLKFQECLENFVVSKAKGGISSGILALIKAHVGI